MHRRDVTMQRAQSDPQFHAKHITVVGPFMGTKLLLFSISK